VESVLEQGHEVRVLDNLSTGKRANLGVAERSVELIVGDVRDPTIVQRAAFGCDVIFHLSAIVSVQKSIEESATTLAVNLGGTLNVLEAAKRTGVRRVVLASSAAVYGKGCDSENRENMPTLPQSPYGLEKLGSEHYLRIWHELYGLETISLRYFNVFGPRQDASSPYSGVISIFADCLARGVAPTIFGDGEQTRDFVYVANVVQANCRAGFGNVTQGIFNVGLGAATSLNQLFATMAQLFDTTVSPIYASARPGDIRHSLADISAARGQLGYQPSVSVSSGLEQLVAFQRSR
jgi:nucleoside-diphosphate-sugar epimerase